MLSKLQRGEFNDFWEIKALNAKKESLPLTVGGLLGRAILQTYGKIISVQLQILLAPLTTEIRSWMHWELSRTIVMLLMYMSWGKLLKYWKIIRLVAMMEFHLKSISLYLSNCSPWCQYYNSGRLLAGKLPSTHPYTRNDHTATEMQIERYSRYQQLQANCNCPSSLHGTWPGLAVATRQVNVESWTADSQFGFKQAHGTEMAIFTLKKIVIRTQLYKCAFLMQKCIW